MEYVVTAEILLRHKTELGSKYQIFRTPNERTNEPTNEPVSRSAKQLTNQPTNQPTSQSVGQQNNQPTSQPTKGGNGHKLYYCYTRYTISKSSNISTTLHTSCMCILNRFAKSPIRGNNRISTI